MYEWCPRCQEFHIVRAEYESYQDVVERVYKKIQHLVCSKCNTTIESHMVEEAKE